MQSGSEIDATDDKALQLCAAPDGAGQRSELPAVSQLEPLQLLAVAEAMRQRTDETTTTDG